MKKDIQLLEEYKDTLMKRIKELQKELEQVNDKITESERIQECNTSDYVDYNEKSNIILELQSQYLKVQGLIIKNI